MHTRLIFSLAPSNGAAESSLQNCILHPLSVLRDDILHFYRGFTIWQH